MPSTLLHLSHTVSSSDIFPKSHTSLYFLLVLGSGYLIFSYWSFQLIILCFLSSILDLENDAFSRFDGASTLSSELNIPINYLKMTCWSVQSGFQCSLGLRILSVRASVWWMLQRWGISIIYLRLARIDVFKYIIYMWNHLHHFNLSLKFYTTIDLPTQQFLLWVLLSDKIWWILGF
jgi:hypothetical protein